jgi:hypothetical protein
LISGSPGFAGFGGAPYQGAGGSGLVIISIDH